MADRSYRDMCGIARALDAVGERWALLVVRELLLGPKRFTDIRRGLPRVGPDVLAQRLRELETNEIVAKRKLAGPSRAQVYELTECGRELRPVLLALGHWGSAQPMSDGTGMSPDSTAIALLTVFDPAAAGDLDATWEIRLGEDRFRMRVADGDLEVDRGGADDAGAVIATDPGTLAQLLWRGLSPSDAEEANRLEITGDRRLAKQFLRLFGAEADA